MAVYKGSRLKNRWIYADNGIQFIDPVVGFSFDKESTDLEIEWREGMRIDQLAKRLYGDEQLEWAILEANPHLDSPFDIKSGEIINVPHPDKVVI